MDSEQSKEELQSLGMKIKAERIKKGFSQTEFANMIGKDQPSLARIENGNVNPGYITLVEIAEGLDISAKDLF